jgi:hypothetical protein
LRIASETPPPEATTVSRPPDPCPLRPVGEAHLEALASVLLAALDLHRGDPSHLVRLRVVGDAADAQGELELGILALDADDHPLDALVGRHAPPEWAAVGVVATGLARSIDPDDGPPPFPVRSAHLVARDGSWAAAWQPTAGAGSGGSAHGPGLVADRASGRIDDALRRYLGLATAPPPASTQRLWALQWLDAVVAAAGDSAGRPCTASTVIGMHPAVAAFDLDPATLDADGLAAAADRLARARGWEPLRRACAAGLWAHPAVDPADARWLDDGAFARWLLGWWPELDDLRDAAASLLSPRVGAVVDAALAALRLESGSSVDSGST